MRMEGKDHGPNGMSRKRKDVVRFLKIVTDPESGSVLVHCLHGADRTGTMCALYRVAVEG